MPRLSAMQVRVMPTTVWLVLWLVLSLDQAGPQLLPLLVRAGLLACLFGTALIAVLMSWKRSVFARSTAATLAYLAAWQGLLVLADLGQLSGLRDAAAGYGRGGLFLIGLFWVTWYAERASQRYEAERPVDHIAALKREADAQAAGRRRAVWNPLDPAAWYYGRQRSKLNQSIMILTAYALVFVVASTLLALLEGGLEKYELPGGGGGGGSGGGPQQVAMTQAVRVQKVIKKKYVLNPFSAIKFEQRPIDDVKLQLVQATDHLYKVGFGQGGAGSGRGKGFGYGDGEGSGFAGGTGLGKIRFIRLEYSGGDWNQDFGVGADQNLLIEYGVRTGQKVNDRTESRTIAQLGSFPAEKSPPLVYLTGQGSITLSKSDVKTLREYLLDKHGMLFGDNGGSQHFHSQFFSMLRQVLPNIEPVRVPLDDEIYRVPFLVTSLPYVAPHGGRDAWGWKVDGRWVCYYHPGDIGDAWSDGHSGVSRDVWDACYRLGINVIFYAHVEYSKWLTARHKR